MLSIGASASTCHEPSARRMAAGGSWMMRKPRSPYARSGRHRFFGSNVLLLLSSRFGKSCVCRTNAPPSPDNLLCILSYRQHKRASLSYTTSKACAILSR